MDEVGNLALETQQLLLRAIQERRYRPVGDKADRNFNVRIIAATNENLEKAVSEKRFRQDLLYRLHDFEITVPPLRDCLEDVMPLAEFFREIANKELECRVEGFSSEARKALLSYPWPGNVRELQQKSWERYCRRRKVRSERSIWNLDWRKHPLPPVSHCATMRRKRNGSCVP